jgi:tetratricopeptide (TPR) repeat protein
MTYEERKAKAFQLVKDDDYLKAMEEFAVLFCDNPNDPDVLKMSEFLLDRIEAGNYDFNPQTADEYLYRGIARLYQGEQDAAIADYDKALTINPEYDYALKCKSYSLRLKQDFVEALRAIQAAIRINPARGEYFDDKAWLLVVLGNYEGALSSHEKAVALEPNSPNLWYNYAVFLGNAGDIEKAIGMLDKALELWPRFPDALQSRDYFVTLLDE